MVSEMTQRSEHQCENGFMHSARTYRDDNLISDIVMADNEPRVWILWNAIQKELSRLVEWISVNLIMLSKVKCNVLHLSISIAWGMDGWGLEKDLGILVDEKLDTSQP
ncbi:hypothetical protein DUI87_07637 [Hirundo rustica rustica]|uniref:Uncharacterized protein n=1 Tax=Hirundo rustica rustica TaxID=333673 RepID=A0A3M0KQS6_HIRRU|nr:hypothetical protein DUI87_07637 [Hirundo rustica rustica]